VLITTVVAGCDGVGFTCTRVSISAPNSGQASSHARKHFFLAAHHKAPTPAFAQDESSTNTADVDAVVGAGAVVSVVVSVAAVPDVSADEVSVVVSVGAVSVEEVSEAGSGVGGFVFPPFLGFFGFFFPPFAFFGATGAGASVDAAESSVATAVD